MTDGGLLCLPSRSTTPAAVEALCRGEAGLHVNSSKVAIIENRGARTNLSKNILMNSQERWIHKTASNEWNIAIEDAGAVLEELRIIVTSQVPLIFQQGHPDGLHPLIDCMMIIEQ
ncbi:hypothetical protein EJB05_46709, partial [Eragrostis curvula]